MLHSEFSREHYSLRLKAAQAGAALPRAVELPQVAPLRDQAGLRPGQRQAEPSRREAEKLLALKEQRLAAHPPPARVVERHLPAR